MRNLKIFNAQIIHNLPLIDQDVSPVFRAARLGFPLNAYVQWQLRLITIWKQRQNPIMTMFIILNGQTAQTALQTFQANHRVKHFIANVWTEKKHVEIYYTQQEQL
jgi:hypothetical protein